MLILGVDPGLATAGYALIEIKGNNYSLVDYGTITTDSDKEDVERLMIIHEELGDIINQYQPEQMAVEELFFNRNVKTAIRVGQARGVIMLCGSEANLEVGEYTPLQVKQAVVGYGRARKKQVQKMVKAMLSLEEIPRPDDAADACAVAICHGHSYANREKWGQIL
ncbi:MAG: crossover junction endodeoxyribonuclease RuvC [Bacillota bacterium]